MTSQIADNSKKIIAFAERHLQPFSIRGNKIHPKLCPFCHGGNNEDQDTFILNIETNGYVCLRGSCGIHGNIFSLAEKFGEHLDLDMGGFRIENKREFAPSRQQLLPRTNEINEYFSKRGISSASLDAYHVSADKSGNIVFPFFETDGKQAFVKYRKPAPYVKGSGQKEWREPGTKPILFGMDTCDPTQPLTITEGMVDALSLYECGVRNIVSVPSGCEDLNWIDLCWDWLDGFEKIILFGDNDAPGKAMVDTVAKRLDAAKCWMIESYPENAEGKQCKDANEILQECGDFVLLDTHANVQPYPIRGIIRLGAVKRVDQTQVPRIKFGIPKLDEVTGGLYDGTVTIFTGQASAGKSTLNGTICLNAIEQKQNVFCYSGELSKEKFLDWILFQAAGSDWITLKRDPYRGLKGEDVPYVNDDVCMRIQEWFYDSFFLADNNELSGDNVADEIIQMIERAYRRYGCHLFVIDNLMVAIAGSSEERVAQIRFITKLKRFAVKYGVVIMLTAHPRKLLKGEKASLNDVSGALELVNSCDTLISVEKPDIRVIKNRDSGINTLIKCCYYPDSRRIVEADVGDTYKFGWNKEGLIPLKVLARTSDRYQPQLSQEAPF